MSKSWKQIDEFLMKHCGARCMDDAEDREATARALAAWLDSASPDRGYEVESDKLVPSWVRANGQWVNTFTDSEGDPLSAELYDVDGTMVLLYLPDSDGDADAVYTLDPEGERMVLESALVAPTAELLATDDLRPGDAVEVWADSDGEGGCVLTLGLGDRRGFYTVASMGADRKR